MRKMLFGLLCVVLAMTVLVSCAPSATPTPTPAPQTATPARPATPKPTEEAVKPKPATATPQTPKPAPDYFANKTIEIIVASGAGGPTDMAGRAPAAFLSQYLPGGPRIIVRNVPGGGGAVALNSFAEKAKPDGLNLLAAAASAVNNQRIGLEIVRYDARKFRMISALSRAESLLFIRKDALPRLKDPKAPAVIVGGREGTESWQALPMWGKEFLGWNVRWIVGFGGSAELELALRRGEIDMFGTGDAKLPQRLANEGLVDIISQIGTPQQGKWMPRPDYPNVPVFADSLIKQGVTGLPWQAFVAWLAPGAVLDRWLAAPPGTPDNVVSLLVDGYRKMAKDPRYDDLVQKTLSPVYVLTYGEEASALVKEVLDTPKEAIDYPVQLQKKFGIIR